MPLVNPITMSSLVKGPPSTTAATMASKPALQPVPIFSDPLSRTIATARPALLVALLILRFNSLMKDPVSTLKTALPVVTVVQVAYAIFCLPVAGSQLAKVAKKPRPGDKKKTEQGGPNQASVSI